MKPLPKETIFSTFGYSPISNSPEERVHSLFLKNMKILIFRSKEYLFKELNDIENYSEAEPIYKLIADSDINQFKTFLNYLDPPYVEFLKKVGNLLINHYIYIEEYEKCNLLKQYLSL